jgi:hypothetical protein
MDFSIADHLIKGTSVPNILIYMLVIAILTLLFSLIVANDMDSKEDQEECFSEEVQAKIDAFNKGKEEEPSKEQIAEIYEEIGADETETDSPSDSDDTSEGEGLPDVLLIVRAKYRDAETLLSQMNGTTLKDNNIEVQDVKFLDFYPSLYTNIPQNLKKIRRNSL